MRFHVSSGALPTGLSLNSATGAITGTPTTAGTFTFTITATDANGCFGQPPVHDHHRQPGLPGHHAESDHAAARTVAVPVFAADHRLGRNARRIRSAIAAGALPPGLFAQSASGLISGAPQQSGLFNFTIRATDSNGCQGSRAYSLAILPHRRRLAGRH